MRSPDTDIHIKTGDTPTVRLEQNGSNGFAAQTCDVGGNDANFSIRDLTAGSTRPFRIRTGAPTSSIDVAANGDVAFGTASPQGVLDIETSSASSSMYFSNNNGSWNFNHNVTPGRFNTAPEGGNTPFKI